MQQEEKRRKRHAVLSPCISKEDAENIKKKKSVKQAHAINCMASGL
jgi:hypothetical protein